MIIRSPLSPSRKPTCSFKCCFQLTHIQVDSQSSSCARQTSDQFGSKLLFLAPSFPRNSTRDPTQAHVGSKVFSSYSSVVKIFGALSEPILCSAPVSQRSFAPPKSCGALSSFFLRSKKNFCLITSRRLKNHFRGNTYFWILNKKFLQSAPHGRELLMKQS